MASKLRGVGEFPGQMAENSVSWEYLEKRMLFKQTLRVASATALWMVALLGANSAMAQTADLTTYSAETLTGDGPTYGIANAGGTGADAAVLAAEVPLNARAAYYIGEADAAADAVFIRVTGTGVMRFMAGVVPAVSIGTYTDADSNATTPDAWTPTGGVTVADGVAVAAPTSGYRYQVTVTGGTSVARNLIRVTVGDVTKTDALVEANVAGMGIGGVAVSVYADQANAHFGDGTPYMSGSKDMFRVARSVAAVSATGLAPVTSIATAISRFTAIAGAEGATVPYEVSVGGFNITVKRDHLSAVTGAALGTAESSLDSLWQAVGIRTAAGAHGSTRFVSPGGWAFASGFRFSDSVNCAMGSGPDGSDPGTVEGDGPGIVSSPLSEENATDDVLGGIKEAAWYLCVTIGNDNDETISAGSYLVDITLSSPASLGLAFPPAGRAGIHVGTIRHDGTRVEIPFVTSYGGYTQRIVIVNRNKVDVSYSLSFRVEGDGTMEGDNPHEGMLAADQATVLKVADLVTLTDPTRAAATLTVAAKSGTVDVATTMVNKMDQSTDTVVLMAQPN